MRRWSRRLRLAARWRWRCPCRTGSASRPACVAGWSVPAVRRRSGTPRWHGSSPGSPAAPPGCPAPSATPGWRRPRRAGSSRGRAGHHLALRHTVAYRGDSEHSARHRWCERRRASGGEGARSTDRHVKGCEMHRHGRRGTGGGAVPAVQNQVAGDRPGAKHRQHAPEPRPPTRVARPGRLRVHCHAHLHPFPSRDG